MLELLLSDPLVRQLALPVVLALLGWMTRQLQKSLAPVAIEARVNQSVATPIPANGNGYVAALASEGKRIDDVREDMQHMEARLMDKMNWIMHDMEDVIDAQNRRITQLERMVVHPPGSFPMPDDGAMLLAQEKRKTDKYPAVNMTPKDEPKDKS